MTDKKEKPKSIYIRCDYALWLAIAKEALRLRTSRSKLIIEVLKRAIPAEL